VTDEDPTHRADIESEEPSYRRSWLAISLGTLVVMVSYSSLLAAIVSSRDASDATGPVFALGFALVPLVFVTVAFVSGRQKAPMAVLKGMGLWLIVALPFSLLNPVFGLSAGYGIGGVVTLKEGDTDRWQARTIAVVTVAAYSFGIVILIPSLTALGVLSGGLLALPALGLADYYTRDRAQPKD